MPNESNDTTMYQKVAALIYAQHGDRKEQLNNCAQLAIDSLTEAMPSEITDQDLEIVFALVAFIVGDIMQTPTVDLSDKLGLLFDTYSLAAGSVAGEVDLGDTSKAKDMAEVLRALRDEASASGHDDTSDNIGQYL